MADINIAPTPRSALTVNLVGKQIKVYAPKSAIAIEMVRDAKKFSEDKENRTPEETLELIDTMFEWLSLLTDAKTVAAIRKRLRDPADGLDIAHILQLVRKVTERAGGDTPTT